MTCQFCSFHSLSSPWFSSPMWALEARIFFYAQSEERLRLRWMWVSTVTYSKQYDHIMPKFIYFWFVSNPSLWTKTKTCLILSSMLTSGSDFSYWNPTTNVFCIKQTFQLQHWEIHQQGTIVSPPQTVTERNDFQIFIFGCNLCFLLKKLHIKPIGPSSEYILLPSMWS